MLDREWNVDLHNHVHLKRGIFGRYTVFLNGTEMLRRFPFKKTAFVFHLLDGHLVEVWVNPWSLTGDPELHVEGQRIPSTAETRERR